MRQMYAVTDERTRTVGESRSPPPKGRPGGAHGRRPVSGRLQPAAYSTNDAGILLRGHLIVRVVGTGYAGIGYHLIGVALPASLLRSSSIHNL
jgi:hypothetical protein